MYPWILGAHLIEPVYFYESGVVLDQLIYTDVCDKYKEVVRKCMDTPLFIHKCEGWENIRGYKYLDVWVDGCVIGIKTLNGHIVYLGFEKNQLAIGLDVSSTSPVREYEKIKRVFTVTGNSRVTFSREFLIDTVKDCCKLGFNKKSWEAIFNHQLVWIKSGGSDVDEFLQELADICHLTSPQAIDISDRLINFVTNAFD